MANTYSLKITINRKFHKKKELINFLTETVLANHQPPRLVGAILNNPYVRHFDDMENEITYELREDI